MGGALGFLDPLGNAAPVTNHMVNFGWEYVWHCHILSHEEMDMMHAMSFATKPKAPTTLTGTRFVGPNRINLTWSNNSLNTTGFRIERASDANFTTGLVTTDIIGTVTTYNDTTVLSTGTILLPGAGDQYGWRYHGIRSPGGWISHPDGRVGSL